MTRPPGMGSLAQQLAFLGLERPGDVHWSHGANSQAKLAAALKDPQIHFIEGDISAGSDGQPIMAHPPAQTSDLSYEAWLEAIVQAGKGAKLDFKSPGIVEQSLRYARGMAAEQIPLMVNADLFQGPGGGRVRFQPQGFLQSYRALLPQAIFSPGWTVGHGGRSYSPAMLGHMRGYLEDAPYEATVCFQVRLLFHSWPEVERLLDATPHTMTVWGKIDEPGLLDWLRASTDPRRAFYDVQTPEGAQVHVMDGAG